MQAIGKAYMYSEAPFAAACFNALQCLSWWGERAKDSNATVISVLEGLGSLFDDTGKNAQHFFRFSGLNCFLFHLQKCAMNALCWDCWLSTPPSTMVLAPKILLTWHNSMIIGCMGLSHLHTHTPLHLSCQNQNLLHPKPFVFLLQPYRTFWNQRLPKRSHCSFVMTLTTQSFLTMTVTLSQS